MIIKPGMEVEVEEEAGSRNIEATWPSDLVLTGCGVQKRVTFVTQALAMSSMFALLSMFSSSPSRLFSFHRPLTTSNCSELSLNSNSPSLWLALYFFFNLSLTLYNKSVLIHFPFPYTLTAIHALCGSIGTWLLLRYQHGGWSAFSPPNKRRRKRSPSASEKLNADSKLWSPGPGVPHLNTKESIVLFFFSILYTINIVVSNASLRLVTVPFHQVVRAATPFFTLLFSAIILRNNFKCTTRKVLCLVPVVAGVGFATYGDYYFTTLGFLLTLLGTVLAAFKTIITHLILTKPSQSLSLTTSSSDKEPTLPLHSPVGYSTVPLPSSSEKDNVFYRHRTPLSLPSAPPRPSSGSPPPQNGIENGNDSLLLSASQYPPAPYSPPAYSYPSLPSSSHSLAPSSHLISPSSSASPSPPPPAPAPPSTFQTKIPKLKLSPLHLLYLLSPLAFIQTTLLAHWTGELQRVSVYLASLSASGLSSIPLGGGGGGAAADVAVAISGSGGSYLTRIGEWVHLSGLGGFQLSFSDLTTLKNHAVPHAHTHLPSADGGWTSIDPRIWLLLNGIMAFWLNVVSFNANRRVGALGMTVAGNVKQVLTIVLGVVIFDLTITRENAVGVVLTVLGGAAYAFVEFGERREKEKEKEKERRG